MAFQGLRQADNTGYIIPTPVISRFLKDVGDGKYDKYVDLGVTEFALRPILPVTMGVVLLCFALYGVVTDRMLARR